MTTFRLRIVKQALNSPTAHVITGFETSYKVKSANIQQLEEAFEEAERRRGKEKDAVL